MVLPSMTYREIYDDLEKDKSKIKQRINKICPKVVREFKKSKSFPLMHVDEYKIPATNNQYIIFYYARNDREIEKPFYTYFCIMFVDNQRFVLSTIETGYQHTPKCGTIKLPLLNIYTSHFFQRYNERFLYNKNFTANQVAGLYLLRNWNIIPIMLNEDINRNYKEHGEDNTRAVRVPDGLCFTRAALEYQPSKDGIREHDELYAIYYLYTTFVSEQELSESQKNAIDKEHLEVLKSCMEDMQIGGK